jgi:hypothetical protein
MEAETKVGNKKPVKWGFRGAAGEGFEPGLTDPESGSVRLHCFWLLAKRLI